MKESSDTFILFFYLILIIIEKKKEKLSKNPQCKIVSYKMCYSKAFLNSLIELKRVLNRVAEPSCYIDYTLSNNLSH